MKKYNLAKPIKYIKDGVEKTYWVNVGTMVEFIRDDNSVSRIIEIPAIGLKANAFEQRPKPEAPQPRPVETGPVVSAPVGEVNPDEIPF